MDSGRQQRYGDTSRRERERRRHTEEKGEWVGRELKIKESGRESNRKMRRGREREIYRPGGHGESGGENGECQVMLEVKEKLLVEKRQHQWQQ